MTLLLLRSCKTLTHEIGHLFGIDHCRYFQCLMNGANHEEESDNSPMHLCPIDLHKLHRQIKFDAKERYLGLREFYTEFGFLAEASWIATILPKFNENTDDNTTTTTQTTTTQITTQTATQTTVDTTNSTETTQTTTTNTTTQLPTVLRCTVTLGGTTKMKVILYPRNLDIVQLTNLACDKLCIKNGRLQNNNGVEISDVSALTPDCKLVLVKCKK